MIGLLILLVIAFFIIGPILTIWALNLVFGLAIETNFFTWAAVLWLTIALHGNRSSGSKDK